MAKFIVKGQRYTLKPYRAKAYGLEGNIVFTASEVFTRDGYARLWVRVKEIAPPYNVFLASDFKPGAQKGSAGDQAGAEGDGAP